MVSPRIAIVWVLCALLLGAGLPWSLGRAPCKANTPAAESSCCGTAECCCGLDLPQQGGGCGCEHPAPAPLPAPPAPKLPPAIGDATEVALPKVAADAEPVTDVTPSTATALLGVTLAQRSRQEALSVWRL
jgi:hypothetical protein